MKYGFSLALSLIIVSLSLWYFDGAWENGEMPTRGVITVSGLAFLTLAFFLLAKRFKKES